MSRWTIRGERVVDETRRLRLSVASVELPDGVQFEQYVLRMPKAAMMVVLDDNRESDRVRRCRDPHLASRLIGLVLAPAAAAGAWTGKKILDRLPIAVFTVLVEAGLITSAILLLLTGG
jgi:hypothetical protein